MTRYSRNDDTENDSFDENVVVHVIPETRSRILIYLIKVSKSINNFFTQR